MKKATKRSKPRSSKKKAVTKPRAGKPRKPSVKASKAPARVKAATAPERPKLGTVAKKAVTAAAVAAGLAAINTALGELAPAEKDAKPVDPKPKD